jgi:hypothetical protein
MFLLGTKLARKDFEFIDPVLIFITLPAVKFVIKVSFFEDIDEVIIF